MRLDIRQECDKNASKMQFFFRKVLLVRKIFVPLHPLNEKRCFERGKRKSSLKDLHRQK